MVKDIAILGCGPAGLLCAHAVEQSGHRAHIISKKQKSVIPGSQYFHESIPGLTDHYPENTVQYVRMGTPAGYAQKVYGDPTRPSGWENYNKLYPSWNVIKAYDRLWERFEDRVIDEVVKPNFLLSIIDTHDLTISTLPAQVLCTGKSDYIHKFEGVPFWIKTVPIDNPVDANRDIFVYNGFPWDFWYRWSIIGERQSVETCIEPDPEDDWLLGIKAVETNCDCWPQVVRAGRWAQWKHGVLLHNAYHTALAAVREL